MKTEQEQIEAIYNLIISHLFEDTVYSLAEQIYEAGYGDVSEYKAEIEYRKKQYDNQIAENTRLYIEYDKAFERLKAQQREIERLRTTLGQCNTELNSALESLKSQCREIGELKAGVKQAKIDVLNELKDKMFEREYMGVKYKQGVFSESEIDELIEEVQNGKDNG